MTHRSALIALASERRVSLKKNNSNNLARCRSIGEHGQCDLAGSRLQAKKQFAGLRDVLCGTTLGSRLEGNRSRIIRSADESQSFSQAPHGGMVDLCLFHSGIPIENGLVDRSLQCLAGLELRYILGSNLNRLTRPRVAARGGFTMTNAKGTEANETYFRASLKGGSD